MKNHFFAMLAGAVLLVSLFGCNTGNDDEGETNPFVGTWVATHVYESSFEENHYFQQGTITSYKLIFKADNTYSLQMVMSYQNTQLAFMELPVL